MIHRADEVPGTEFANAGAGHLHGGRPFDQRETLPARMTLIRSWGAAELYAAVAVLALLVIKILFHIGNFGWGFYVNMLLAIVLVYGATGLRHSRTVRPVAAPAPQHGN